MRRATRITCSIAYAERTRHTLDVCRPPNAVAAPVVVFFYGGAWRSGNKEMYRYVGKALARCGYVAVVPDYRIYPEVCYPEFIEDAALAVRWVRDNIARFGGDPDKIFLMGHSAGAHIAAMLATDAHWLQQVELSPRRDISGLIGISGPYDFMPLRIHSLAAIFGGIDRPETQPIFHVATGVPPALLLTGGKDPLVEPGNSIRFAVQLRKAGNDATVQVYPRIGHFFTIAALAPFLRLLAPVLRDVDAFITALAQSSPRTMQAAE
jgi:acetyl esterase/lipase